MAKRIKQLKIRQADGTWSESYDIGFSDSSVTEFIQPQLDLMLSTIDSQLNNMNSIGFHRFSKMLNDTSSAIHPTAVFSKTENLKNFQYDETTDTLFVFFNGLLLVPDIEYSIYLNLSDVPESIRNNVSTFTDGDIIIDLNLIGQGDPPHVFDEEYLELIFFRKYVKPAVS